MDWFMYVGNFVMKELNLKTKMLKAFKLIHEKSEVTEMILINKLN